MQKEEIVIDSQLLTGMRDAADKLEEALNKKDAEALASAKRDLLNFQSQIDKML